MIDGGEMSGDVLKIATYNANSIRVRLELVLDWLGQAKPDC